MNPGTFEEFVFSRQEAIFHKCSKRFLFVPELPVPQSRPRFSKNGRVYELKKCAEYKKRINFLAKEATKNTPPIEGKPLVCTLLFGFPLPAKATKADKEKAKKQIFFKTTKPDIDNLEKAILDALTGICWKDDNQIVSLSSAKIYSPFSPFTLVSLWETSHWRPFGVLESEVD